MSLLHYIDNEVPAFGEWDAVVVTGNSSIGQSTEAAFPERGQVGLRAATTLNNVAYVRKDTSIAVAPGGTVAIQVWYRPNAFGTGNTPYVLWGFGTNNIVAISQTEATVLRALFFNDGGGYSNLYFGGLAAAQWYCLTVVIKRATTAVAADGSGTFYVNGALIGTAANIDNYDRADSLTWVRIGSVVSSSNGFIADFDEFKIATSYPEPYVPTPETAYPEARRTVVLFRQANGGSRDFADYCVEKLGIPRSNLCPLPNATATETLATYATFQAQVENDLAAWLGRNPTVAANVTTFLLGYGVPGYFMHDGARHSATSRLMHYGTAFSSQTANPLYLGAGLPASRLNVDALRSAGVYLCIRIDADTLANAKAIIDRDLAVRALAALPDADKLYSDDAAYKASLPCQHLRMETAAVATLVNDAFAWYPAGVGFGAAGSRVSYVETANSAVTLRATSCEIPTAIISHGYATGLGTSAGVETFDAESEFDFAAKALTIARRIGAGKAVDEQQVRDELADFKVDWSEDFYPVDDESKYQVYTMRRELALEGRTGQLRREHPDLDDDALAALAEEIDADEAKRSETSAFGGGGEPDDDEL